MSHSTSPKNQTPPGATPTSSEPDPGLSQLEERFRTIAEQTVSSMRDQTSAFESVVQMAAAAMQERTTLSGEKASLRSAVEQLTEERNRLDDSLENAERDGRELRAAVEDLQSQRSELTTTRQQVRDQLEASKTENNRLVAANSALEEEIATVTEAAERANRELNSVRQSLQGQLAEVKATSQSLGNRVESLEETNRELCETRDDLERQVATSRDRTRGLEENVEAARREQIELESVNETLNEQIGELQAECDTLRAQAVAAEEERSKLLSARQSLEACLTNLSANAGDVTVSAEAERELATLRARVQELESVNGQVETLQTRIAELETSEPDASSLHERINELETALEEALEHATAPPSPEGTSIGPVPVDSGLVGSDTIIRDLTLHTRSAEGIASGLQQPRIDDQQRQMLIRAAASLAAHLEVLRATVELSQPETTLELRSARTCPAETLKSVIESVSGFATSRKIGLRLRSEPAVPGSIITDGVRMHQLLCWGMTFATRHAAEGEIEITVSPTDDGQHLCVEMLCGGVGLSADEVASIVTGSSDEVATFGRLAEALGGKLRVEHAGKQGFVVRMAVATHQATGGAGDRRSVSRVYQELLQCNLGPVVDLTPGGIRVIGSKAMKGRITVELPGPNGLMRLRATVVWTNRLDKKQIEMGLSFVDLKPSQAEQVAAIARAHGLAAAG